MCEAACLFQALNRLIGSPRRAARYRLAPRQVASLCAGFFERRETCRGEQPCRRRARRGGGVGGGSVAGR